MENMEKRICLERKLDPPTLERLEEIHIDVNENILETLNHFLPRTGGPTTGGPSIDP
jgi:hypothetical protein